MPPASQRLRMRALSTGASRRGLVPMISIASASSIPAMRGVEAVEIAPRGIELRAVLPAVEVGRAERGHQVLQRQHALGIAQIAGDGADALARHAAAASPRSRRTPRPRSPAQLAVAAHPGPVEPAALQPVDREARLVGQPLLVHVLIECAAGCAAPRARAHRCGCWCRPHPARRRCRSSTAPRAARRRRRASRSARRPGRGR